MQEVFLQKRLLVPVIERHGGDLLEVVADSMLATFGGARTALACAVDMQRACQAFNASRAPEDQVLLCAGLGAGRILRIGPRRIAGVEVNSASKLGEDLARANEILVTGAARAAIEAAGGVTGVRLNEIEARLPGSERNYRAEY